MNPNDPDSFVLPDAFDDPLLSRDGRQVDTQRAELIGEGAQQVVETIGGAKVPFEIWSHLPSAGDQKSYYDRPAIKEPVWIWAVPLYFYVGGASGAALTLGAVAQILKPQRLRDLIRHCRWIGAIGCTSGTGLLIYDLGRPERFLNMLRIFRPTSPMSVGSWTLALTGSFAGIAAAGSLMNGRAKRVADTAAIASGVLGIPLAGYTGVLLSNTAVPLWQQAHRTLPVLFIASGVAAASALLEAANLSEPSVRVASRFGIAGDATVLYMMSRIERDADTVPEVARPLHEGFSGFLWKSARALVLGSLALSLLPGKSRARKIAAAAAGTAGAIALRFAIVQAGHASARDPQATFQPQRQRVDQ